MKNFPHFSEIVDRVADRLSPSNLRGPVASDPRVLEVEILEPRVLFSGSPSPSPEPAPEAAPAAQESSAGESGAAPATEDSEANVAVPPEAQEPEAERSAAVSGDTAVALTDSELEMIADAAAQRWIDSGLSEAQVAALGSISYQIADLGDNRLGVTSGTSITIDDDAAGSGYFVDSTPDEDGEFGASGSGEARSRYDLLTVLLHEQGHILGLEDDSAGAGDVMFDSLALGQRRTPLIGEALGAEPGSLAGEHAMFTGTETYETGETDGATTFSEPGGPAFDLTGEFIVVNANTFGSGGSNWFVESPFGDSQPAGAAVGSINVAPNFQFVVSSLDVGVSNNQGSTLNTSGNLTFTGTLAAGGTVSESITVTSAGGNYQTVNFAGTALNGQELVSLEIAIDAAQPIDYVAFDNFNYVSDTNTNATTGISYQAINGDADSGINSSKVYTHALDFGNQTAFPQATINGVVFGNGSVGVFPSPAGTSQTVGTGSTTLPNSHPGGQAGDIPFSGEEINDLLGDMIFNDITGEITLTGLTPGAEYQFKLYNRRWSDFDRSQTIGFDTDGISTSTSGLEHTGVFNPDRANEPDPGFATGNQVFALTYDYTLAPGVDTLTVYIDATGGGSYHLYGLTNEEIPVFAAADAVDDSYGTNLILNGGFEADTYTNAPGYTSGNGGVITGWNHAGAVGINPGPNSPFRDNGDNATQVAFIQATGSLSQMVTGLEVGGTYELTFDYNERSTNGGGTTIMADIAGANFTDPANNPVGGSNPYHQASLVFTATSASELLTLSSASNGGDQASLFDNVSIVQLISEDAVLAVPEGRGVLANDSGSPIEIVLSDSVSANGAAVTVNPDGSFAYDPRAAAAIQALNSGDTLTDTFTYTITSQLPAGTPSTASQNSAGAFAVSGADLVDGITATVTGTPLPGVEGTSSDPNVLTDGNFGTADAIDGTNNVAIQAGTILTYDLDLSGTPQGFDIDSTAVYSGWQDAGRVNQNYTVRYATVLDPSTFITLTGVNYVAGNNSAETVVSGSGGVLAHNVASVQFEFGPQQNGHVGYREIDVIGTASSPFESATVSVVVSGAEETFNAVDDPGAHAIGLPTQTRASANAAFTVSGGDVLEGLIPVISSGSISGAEGTSPTAVVLTNGTFGPATSGAGSPGYVESAAITNNTTLTYTLDTTALTGGYSISGVSTYSGWGDAGRDNQNYTVQYATVGSPGVFVDLFPAVSFAPAGGPLSGGEVTNAADAGSYLATNVGEIRFVFGAQENGYVGYRELDVFGIPTEFVTNEETAFTVTAPGVLANDSSAATVVNSDFETDANLFTVFPGYLGGGNPSAIPGWTYTQVTGNAGINPISNGQSPFKNNGNNPSHVAFIQRQGTLSQDISGLTVGQTYELTFDYNARNNTPDLLATIGGETLQVDNLAPVGGANPWYKASLTFTAGSTTETLSIGNLDNTNDNTLLIDNVAIHAPVAVISSDATSANGAAVSVNPDGSFTYDPTTSVVLQNLRGTESITDTFTYTIIEGDADQISYLQITNDADSGIDSSKTYTHAIDFGTSGAATVNGVAFSNDVGIAAGGILNSGTRTYGPNNHPGNTPPAVTGSIASVFQDMRFNGPDGGYIELTGLTADQWYDVRLYDRAWDFNGSLRTYQVGYDMGGDGTVEVTTPVIDQNRPTLDPPGLSGNVSWATSHLYQADATGVMRVIIDLADNFTGSYHLYGLTNEAVAAPTIKSATVSVVVDGIEDPSIAVNDTLATDEDTILTGAAAGVLTNDLLGDGGILVQNFDFEGNAADFTAAPGYIGGANPAGIDGWNHTGGGAGINPGNGAGAPFRNNGDNATNVVFLQNAASISQDITGLTVGQTYSVNFDYNSRAGYAAPNLQASIAGATFSDPSVVAVGGANAYYKAAFSFTASAANETLTIQNLDGAGDDTLLVDNVVIHAVPVVVSADNTSALGAAVTVNTDGSYTYDPTGSTAIQSLMAGETAQDTFTYAVGGNSIVRDATGVLGDGASTSLATVTNTDIGADRTLVIEYVASRNELGGGDSWFGVMLNPGGITTSDQGWLARTTTDNTAAHQSFDDGAAQGTGATPTNNPEVRVRAVVQLSAAGILTGETASITIQFDNGNDGTFDQTLTDDFTIDANQLQIAALANGKTHTFSEFDVYSTAIAPQAQIDFVSGGTAALGSGASTAFATLDNTAIGTARTLVIEYDVSRDELSGGDTWASMVLNPSGVGGTGFLTQSDEGWLARTTTDSTGTHASFDDGATNLSGPTPLNNPTVHVRATVQLSAAGILTGESASITIEFDNGSDGTFDQTLTDVFTIDADQLVISALTHNKAHTYSNVNIFTPESGTATVTVNVTGVDDAPVNAEDHYATDEDTALAVPAGGVLTNDFDADSQVVVTNFDFETGAGAFTQFPGYLTQPNNPAQIEGWTSTAGGVGLNPGAGAGDPFRNNGANLTNVAFIQGNGTISQTIDGLVIGDQYRLKLDYNARANNTIGMDVTIAGATLSQTGITNVDPAGVRVTPWHLGELIFTATATSELLSISAVNLGGDNTLLVDNVTISHIAEENPIVAFDAVSTMGAAVVLNADGSFSYDPNAVTATAIQALPENSTATDTFTYTVAGLQDQAITDLFNTGADAGGAALGNGVDDPHYQLINAPVTIGAGGDLAGATGIDNQAGGRNNIDKVNTVTLGAGTYDVPEITFNAQDGGAGAVIPFLARDLGGGSYETLWVGAPIDAVTGISTVTFTGESFTLTGTTEVFSGIYHDGIDRIFYANGGSTDHDGGAPVDVPTAAGQTISGISNPNLPRTYAFGVNLEAGIADATVAEDGFPIPPWAANDADSRWIGPDAPDGNGESGDFTYRTTFTVPADADLGTLLISGSWATDNVGVDILINGVSTGQTNTTQFGSLTSFSIGSGFVTGTNTIDFVVNNAGSGPTGLRVDNLTGIYDQLVPTTVNVALTGLNDAPVLTGTNDFEPVAMDDVTNMGQPVSELVGDGFGDFVTDVDVSAVEGIAVTANSTSGPEGTFQYSTDGGTGWTDVGAVSDTSALLLRIDDLVRYVPNGGGGATGSITFKGWDQTGATLGQQGSKVTTLPDGGTEPTSAFSAASATANASVVNVIVEDGMLIYGEGTGRNDLLEINSDGTNLIIHDDAGPVISGVPGATQVDANTVSIPLTAFEDLLVRANDLDDTITIGDMPGFDGSLTIDGEDGFDTVTFARGMTLALGTGIENGPGDENLSVDAETVKADLDAALSVVGGGTIDITATGGGAEDVVGIQLRRAGLSSEDGAITLVGEGGSSGNHNDGVLLSHGSSITTTGGSVSITGTATSAAGPNDGVSLVGGSDITVGGAGTITITGTSNGASDSYGVQLFTGTELTSAEGDISLAGGGNGTGARNSGIYTNGATVTTTGAGSISLDGEGSGGGTNSKGLRLTGSTLEAAGTGGITLTGTGGGGTSTNVGVEVGVRTSLTTASGDVTITGEGAGSATRNAGVSFLSRSSVDSGGGITVTGTGGDGTSHNDGVSLVSATLDAGGDISVTGVGAGSGNYNRGIDSTRSSFGGGEVTLTGTGTQNGGGSARFGDGVYLNRGGATAAGTLTIGATGGTGSSNNRGLYASGVTLGGTLAVTGTADAGTTGSGNAGVFIQNSTLSALGTIAGTGGGGTGPNFGVYMQNIAGGLPATSVTTDPNDDDEKGGNYFNILPALVLAAGANRVARKRKMELLSGLIAKLGGSRASEGEVEIYREEDGHIGLIPVVVTVDALAASGVEVPEAPEGGRRVLLLTGGDSESVSGLIAMVDGGGKVRSVASLLLSGDISSAAFISDLDREETARWSD